MKEKILLINPPIRETAPPSMFPSGLGYIAAVLLKEEYDVRVLDINGYRYDKDTVKRKVEEYIKKGGIRIIGIGCLITCYNYVKWLIDVIKDVNQETTVIVGGGLGSSIPELCIEKLRADIVVIGEGEVTIAELLKAMGEKKDLSKVRGIAIKRDDKVVKTMPQIPIKDLDPLPLPAWDLFPMDIYLKNQFEVEAIMDMKENSMNVISGRGCPFHCTFCYEALEHRAKTRSPKRVAEEVKILHDKYNVRIIYFADDLFAMNKQWMLEFCDEIIKNKLDVKWLCTARVNTIDEEMLVKMKEAGCILVNFGIESGSQRMLNIMKKGVTTEQAAKAVALVRRLGFRLNLSFMMGFPEETKETLKETIDFCVNNDIHITAIFFVTPYPGTPLYEEVKSMGLIKDEEQFVRSLGNATELTINLTRWNDKELLGLRDWVVSSIHKAYYLKHKAEYIQWLRKKFIWYGNYIKVKGLGAFIGVGFKKAGRAVNKIIGIKR